MTPSLTISLLGVALTLAAILVQLGRVLQRAEQNEAALRELKEQREKELKPQSEMIELVRQRTHDLASAIQAVNANHTLLETRLTHSEVALSDLRRDQTTGAGELRIVLAEVLDRLARIETAIAHGSAPPPLPASRASAPGPVYGPPRRTLPGEPR